MKRLTEFSIRAIVFIDKILEAVGFAPRYGWILWWAGIDPGPMLRSMREFRVALNELCRALAEAEREKRQQHHFNDSPGCARLDAMRPPAISKEHWN